ncbi:translation initiation factor IF-2-like [Cocos nucifera]|uniref:Translation initiation factor IF-2-like n=1 Tax=Cocos nucifera TaxID=13894 RepID=A0A8K0NBV7_COCNU|nr:translation initiation factor IF-2-like [Cocos nucifera]
MESPALLLWSSAASPSSSQENRNDSAAQNRLPPPPDSAPKDSSPARPKPKKASKRPPQRGLGVAQLERLRLQERWKKITETHPAREIQPFPGQLSTYEYPAAVSGSGLVQAPGMCCIQRCPQASQGLAGRSVLQEQYALDRYRMGRGEGRFQVGSLFPELPSNQKMQCFTDQCEFCARKKRLFGMNPGFVGQHNGVDYFEMDLAAAMAVDQESQTVYGCGQRRGKSVTESSEVKEFDFFPQSRSASFGHSEFGNRIVGDASSSSSSSAAASPSFLDLSLKLSI